MFTPSIPDPAISGRVERAAFRASIPARGAARGDMSAYRDVVAYRNARAARVIGSH